MTTWTAEELQRIGEAEELRIASRRPDGSLRPYLRVWAVRVGDAVYVRSAYGYNNPWFQRALQSGEGRVRAGGAERDVTFEVPGPEVAQDVSGAYHANTTGMDLASSGRSCRGKPSGRHCSSSRSDM